LRYAALRATLAVLLSTKSRTFPRSKECRENLSHQIPWPNIIGMRNRLIHAYFDINLDILWKTVTEDIPLLIDNLEKVLPPNEIQ
jgi:uncharacterized protein with HEPN domain